MPTAYSIAARQYVRPTTADADADQSGLRYSIHADAILQFLAVHRTALASHVRRHLPDLFSTDRDARRHLRTLAAAGELNVVTYNDPRRPNVYVITERGLDHARDLTSETIPFGRNDPNGDHLLHEILITELAVSRHEFIRSRDDFYSPWEQRFGFHDIPGFENLIPDYAQLSRGIHGHLVDFVEVLSGERSVTRVRQKLEKYAVWSESDVAREFLTTLYRYFGAAEPRPVFRLLVIAHNRNLIGADDGWERNVLGAMFCVPKQLQRRIWTTTNAALNAAPSINCPIWHCGTDLLKHRARVLDTPKRTRRQVLFEIVSEMPRHELFTFCNRAV